MGQAIDIYSLYADETDKGKRYFSPWCWASTFAIRHKVQMHILCIPAHARMHDANYQFNRTVSLLPPCRAFRSTSCPGNLGV